MAHDHPGCLASEAKRLISRPNAFCQEFGFLQRLLPPQSGEISRMSRWTLQGNVDDYGKEGIRHASNRDRNRACGSG